MRYIKFLFLYYLIFACATNVSSQVCNTDSNFYSIRYNTANNVSITNGIITPQNEVATLLQNPSSNTSFLAKYTAQGNVLWSNEYIPDYPYVNWLQFPWYTDTKFTGILPASDSTYYIYGSSIEHGRTIDNVEDPPNHLVGLFLKIDKFGKCIDGRYFGNWHTDYSVNSVTQTNDGGLLVFLRSHMSPFRSKLVLINKGGDIVWGIPLEPSLLYYYESPDRNPMLKQLRNGNIVVLTTMRRDIDDTLFYPFTPPILLVAPLTFFSTLVLDGKNGEIIAQSSSECPSLTYSNIDKSYVPEVKSITELPNGDLSFCIDMYWPVDNVIFYKHKVFSRRAMNFIANRFGLYKGLFSYKPENSSCSLESVWQTGNGGEQILLVKDSTNDFLILFAIDDNGKVEWSKTYKNGVNTPGSKTVALQKKNGGYSIFQSDPALQHFEQLITSSSGKNTCAELPPVKIIQTEEAWQWPPDKVSYVLTSFDLDFRYAGFHIVQNPVPISQDTYCKYQFECCKDIIDTVHRHKISLCENQTYTLPDNTIVTEAGSYYQTLSSKAGCDSIIYYDVKLTKSPSHLLAPADTCLNDQSSIHLTATGGYDSYLWNNFATPDSSYTVQSTGTYTVRVTNVCGTKTDTINVYEKCDFPIYFPTAFSPNGDQLNDLLRVPFENKNRLISLKVYNRYGQVVFSTFKKGEGWDGNFRGVPQATGAYTYILKMEGLTGQKLNQKGTVMLLR